MHWHIESPGQFYRDDTDSAVYFNPASGDTHLLGQLAVYVLDQLREQPLELEGLAEKLSHETDMPKAELRRNLQAIIEDLATLDIVQAL